MQTVISRRLEFVTERSEALSRLGHLPPPKEQAASSASSLCLLYSSTSSFPVMPAAPAQHAQTCRLSVNPGHVASGRSCHFPAREREIIFKYFLN